MSIKIMNEAWEVRGIDPTTKLILMCLADHANEDDRTCWPAISTIARKCDVSRATVKRRMQQLEQYGLISRRSRTGDSTLYYIMPTEENGGVVQSEPGSLLSQGRFTVEPGGGSLLSHKPSINHQEPEVCRFSEFWDCFADKRGRAAALRTWKRHKLNNIADEVIAGARRYAANRGSDRRYWKQAQGWLNDGRWADETGTTTSTPVCADRKTVFVEAGTPEWASWRAHDATIKPIQSSAGFGRWLPSKLPPSNSESA